MHSSSLVLLGAFDTLIAIIQRERNVFCKTIDPEAAVQTLKKVKAEFVRCVLELDHAEMRAADTFRVTADQFLAVVPQGSDTEALVRSLQALVVKLLPEGPTPPSPSLSSSQDPLGLRAVTDLKHLIAALQEVVERKVTIASTQ